MVRENEEAIRLPIQKVPVKAQVLGPTLPLPEWAKRVRRLLNYPQPVSGSVENESYTTIMHITKIYILYIYI